MKVIILVLFAIVANAQCVQTWEVPCNRVASITEAIEMYPREVEQNGLLKKHIVNIKNIHVMELDSINYVTKKIVRKSVRKVKVNRFLIIVALITGLII